VTAFAVVSPIRSPLCAPHQMPKPRSLLNMWSQRASWLRSTTSSCTSQLHICVVWTAPCHRIPQGARHWICWLRRVRWSLFPPCGVLHWQAQNGRQNQVRQAAWQGHPLVDHLFWNLPFCSVKQSQAVRKKAGVTEEEWSTKCQWEEIVAEHDLPGAHEQLASGWKDYLGMRAGEAAGGAGTVWPACLTTVVLDTQCKPGGPKTRAQRA